MPTTDPGFVSLIVTVCDALVYPAVNPYYFLNASGTASVVEYPAISQGTMTLIHDDAVITDDRFTIEDGRMRIQQNDEGVYRCSISLLGIVDSIARFKTANILERDGLTPRVIEPPNSIQAVYGDPLDLVCLQRGNMQSTSTVILICTKTPKETRSLQNFKAFKTK